MNRSLLILALSLLCRATFASDATMAATTEFPVAKIDLNPALKLTIVEQKAVGAGFLLRASDPRFEVAIKGTPMKNEALAKQMGQVELGTVKNLYNPKTNPYRGQITDLLQCKAEYMPKNFPLRIDGREIETLAGGANARKLFGACTPAEVAYWAQYFNFYDESNQRLVEVRIFEKADDHNAKKNAAHLEELKKFGESLFVSRAG